MSLSGPPDELPRRPKTVALTVGSRLLRVFDPRRGDWQTQRRFGPIADMRFDHHLLPTREHEDRSVWYAATSVRGVVSEAFGRTGLLDREAGHRIAVTTVARPLDLLDLVGVAARRVGLTQEIAATTQYETCQAWARSFYDQYRELHGIRWRGRQAGSLCVVLNDRASMENLEAVDYELIDPRVWPRIARAARDCGLTIV